MTQEKKVQTAAVMDVTGIERAAQDAVRAAKTMADGITREGEKAGKGIEAMGEGATRAERTVDAKTKSISDRIRRLTVQSQRELAGLAASSAGGAGSAAAVEYEATIRGADVAKLQPQIAALRELQTQANALSAAMRQAMVGDEFIAGVNQRIAALQRQAAGAKMAEADMLALRAAELGVTQQADPLIAKLRATAAAAEEAAAATKRAAAGDSFLQGLSAQANAIGKTRADLLALKAAELGVAQQAAPMIAAIRAADGELMGMGKNAKLTAAALRTVPAQFTDIVVSLQAGQNPLQVFLQQGGQLKDQFGGIGPAAQALGSYILGLVNPYTLAATAVVGLTASFIAANNGISAATRVLIESGNQAGITAGQLQGSAEAIAALGGSGTNRAAELLAELAKSGDLGAAGLQRYAAAAIEFERAGGQAADKTVEAFNELGKSPVAASLKLNNATNFLTKSLFEQIRALEDQNRTMEAAKVAADAYADAIEARTPAMEESLNILQRAWRGVGDEAKGALEFYLDFFRSSNITEQRDRIRAQIAELKAAGQQGYVFGPSIQDLQERDRNLQELERLDQKSAERDQARKLQVDATAEIAKLEAESLSKQQKLQRELAKFNRTADAAGIDGERRSKLEAAIREKYADKGSSKADRGLAKAQLAEELQGIRSAEAERQTIYRQSEQIIEAQRRAGLLSEEAYFEARKSLAEGDAEARISALQQEILVMSRFKGTATEQAQVRKDIAAAAGRIGQASAEAIARDIVLRTDQTAAIEAQRRALVELQQAADAEYTSLTRRLGVQVRETGQGTRRTSEEAQLESTAADFTRRQAQLDAEYRNGRLRGREEQYRAELDLLIREEGRQLAAIEEFQRRKREADNDYRLGAKRGIENVIDGTFDTAARTARLTEDAFTGLGDALTDVFTKGKVGWSSLEQTILSGITRIIVEQQLIRPIAQYLQGGAGGDGIVGALGSVLGSVLGGGTGGGLPDSLPTRGGRAAGGPVERGGLYEINETGRGPGEVLNVGGRQYLMALQAGYVQPVASMQPPGQARVLQQTNNFHVSGSIDRRTQQQLAMQAGRQAQTALNRNG